MNTLYHSKTAQWLTCPFTRRLCCFGPFPPGTSPHAPTSVHVAASSTWANVSWEASYDGGFQQTFSVWYGLVWVIPACFASCFFLLPMHYLLLLKMSFSGLCSEQLWKQRHGKYMDVPCVWVCISNGGFFLPKKLPPKKTVATKLNMTQSLLSCCCYCFAAAWLGDKTIFYSLFLPWMLQPWQT